MHILDECSSKKLDRVILYLTASEAHELIDSLQNLLENPTQHHSHVSDKNYQKEITVCVYDTNNLSSFDERSKNLILDDE